MSRARYRRGGAGLVAAALALGVVSGASGASLSTRLRQLVQGREQVQSELREIKQEQRSASQRLHQAQTRLETIQTRLDDIRAQLVATRRELAAARQELKRLGEAIEEHTDYIHQHLLALYRAGERNYLEVLLASESFSDFANRRHFIRAVVNQDQYILNRLEGLHVQAEEQRRRLQEREQRRAALEKEIAAQEAEARRRRAEVRSILAEANSRRATAEAMLAKMEAEQREIAAMVRARSGPSSSAQRYEGAWSGRFLKPVEGRFTSGFGWRLHPITKTRRFHHGIDLAAPTGTPIKAADQGLVIFSGWRGEVAGRTVIIDHGSGVHTVYCHLSSELVKAGEIVTRGQVIGRVGSTGWSTGPHLHFGILKNGDFVDPANYVL